jgi:hypothetical protein
MGYFFDALTSKRHGVPEPIQETAAVLAYESGRVLENSMYMYWNNNDVARRGFVKSELIDVIAQCQLLCESLGCDFEEMRQMGIEKAMERFTGKERK